MIELKPKWNIKLLLDEIKEGLRYQRNVVQKDFLEQCRRRTVCPAEILAIACRVDRDNGDSRNRNRNRNRKEESRILGIRIDNKKKEIRERKERWTAETRRVNHILDLSSEGNQRIRMLRNDELRRFWNKDKERMNRKLDKLVEKQNPVRKSTIPNEYMGILIGDQELITEFGELDIKVAVYGGITPSDNVIRFLQLPAKFRVYNRIEKIIGNKKTEEYAAGRRWDIRDRNENDRVGMNPDELRQCKDK